MKRLLLATLLSASAAQAAPGGSVVGSKHDLSASGPGAIRSAGQSSPCAVCHFPHLKGAAAAGASTAAKLVGAGPQKGYESSTMQGKAGGPTGSSRACLGCHDGTVAIGGAGSAAIAGQPIPAGRGSNLGTDLRGSHPVSLQPVASRKLKSPRPGEPVQLDRTGQVQCTSCHDPHAERNDPDVGKFLVARAARSQLCLACHDPLLTERPGSSHAASSAPMPPLAGGPSPFGSVGEAGCLACHQMHGADPRGQLLRAGRTDDDGCLVCHASTVTRLNLARDLTKPWAHAAAERGVHDAAEGPLPSDRRRLPEVSPAARRHVTCVDCHGAHGTTSARAEAPAAGGVLGGAWGIDLDGRRVEPARFEYEICLKCHGDSANQPQASGLASASAGTTRRAVTDLNLRRVFSPTAPSFHPVAAPGKNRDVPGLKAPYTESSFVFCTDCHASNDGPGAGGGGARGPHGSTYPALLERNYATADRTVEGPGTYALCYKCHDREVLLSSASGFPAHRKHVVDSATPCAACHAAHGVSSQAGTAQENAHLVDFDVTIVGADAVGRRQYLSTGPKHGSCAVTCHGRPHTHGESAY